MTTWLQSNTECLPARQAKDPLPQCIRHDAKRPHETTLQPSPPAGVNPVPLPSNLSPRPECGSSPLRSAYSLRCVRLAHTDPPAIVALTAWETMVGTFSRTTRSSAKRRFGEIRDQASRFAATYRA